jgi:hypothetical protein
MSAKPVAGDEAGDPVRYAVALHVLMSQAEMELWESLADRYQLEVDDVVHAAALSGLQAQLARDGDDGWRTGRVAPSRRVLSAPPRATTLAIL